MKPHFIEFKAIGSAGLGYISVAEQYIDVPFEVKRVYWTYFTPQDVQRGGHANIDKKLVLIAVSGSIKVRTELQDGTKNFFILDKPNQGLYLPKLCWHTMQYSHNAVQLVLASNLYAADDYIRDYQAFLKFSR